MKKADRYGVWTIDKKQLRLLSQFPSFNGVAGSWVGRYRHNMPNLSGCLGSYGLIDPTEFLFVGAPDLTNFLGWRRRVRRTEILSLGGTLDTRFELPLPPSFGSRANLANYRYASNAVDFSSRFLRLGVGELVFLPPGYWDNPQARRVRWDLAVSARRHSSAEYPERGIEALKLLSLPYAMADNPAVNFPPNEPLPPPDLGLGDNGIGVVISTLVVGE